MAAVVSQASSVNADRSIAVLRTLFGPEFAREFSVELWDGTRIDATGTSRFTLKVNEPFALRAAFAPPFDLSPGRAFVEKWIDVDGDLESSVEVIEGALGKLPRLVLPKLAGAPPALPKPPPPSSTVRHERQAPLKKTRCRSDRISLRSTGCILPELSRPEHGLFVRVLG